MKKWNLFVSVKRGKITATLVEEGKLDYSIEITKKQLPWFNALRNGLVADGHQMYREDGA